MRQALLIIDVQPSFSPPQWLIDGIQSLIGKLPSVATVERHDESRTPFQRQLGWHPAADDDSLIAADRIFIKYGYAPSPDKIEYLKSLNLDRVLVCGLQTETCCLAAGFALFDAGLQPTLLTDLTVGSSLDRSGGLGVKLWKHHFKHTLTSSELRSCLQAS
ncbi:cysteine hydrolase family protein [Pseudomonas fluorescens]|uniref:cysteine hydrolase family protein n=1 Tax=Pseudomonas fluorescens TaxID=294 RepID=UPI001A9FEF1E|nr:cysteine hydrolase family protein [Pseudomonas fluorescens]QTD34204.1 cysteine hydrolase family protein [Pseudomonas fluorescens]